MISLLLILSFLLNLGLAWIVFVKNRHSRVNVSFAVLAFLFSIFALSFFFYYNPLIFSSLFWIKIIYTLVSLLVIALFYFSDVFPGNSKPNLKILASYIVLNLPIIWVLFTTPYYVVKVIQTNHGQETITGWFYLVVAVILIPAVLFPVLILIKKYKSFQGLVKQQLLYILLGVSVWAFIGIIFDAIFPILFKTSEYFALNSISSLALVSLATYAIVKSRLFDIRFVVLRTIAYSLFVLFLATICAVILSLIGFLINISINVKTVSAGVFAGLIIIFSFLIFQKIFQKITDKIFYRDRYNPQALVAKIGKIVASSIELSHISEAVLKEFLAEIKIAAGALAISKSGTVSRVRQIGEMENPSDNGQALCKIIENIVKSPGENVLVKDEIAESDKKQLMERGKYSVILPLIAGSEIVGAIILGSKTSGQVYSTEDIEILKILAPQIAVAIKNALSYEQTKQFNLLLQVKVENATENLKNANDRLKDLDKLKDEFVSITSHELRTPMTIIKGYVWRMLNDKKEGELSDKNKQRLQLIYNATEREIALVNDVLDISRIEAGTMVFEPKVFNIAKLAGEVKKELSDDFAKKNISLTVQKAAYKVNADENNIHQVLINLLTNAMNFTNAGGKVNVKFKKSGEFVEISVSDTGVGIKKSDFPKLFTKFGRLGNVLSPESSGGTGLGLYLCKKLIEKSKGEISVKSEVGKGSIFTFSLPKAS